MIEWYYILFAISCMLFVILLFTKDENIGLYIEYDSSITSLITFKSFVHFLFGFTGTLSCIAKFGTNRSLQFNPDSLDLDVVYNFTVMNYITAAIIGVFIACLLYYAHKIYKEYQYKDDDIM